MDAQGYQDAIGLGLVMLGRGKSPVEDAFLSSFDRRYTLGRSGDL